MCRSRLAPVRSPGTPSPLNLFMNVPWRADGNLTFKRPTSEAGQHVSLRAEMALIIVLSACPQDMNAINGERGPSDVAWQVVE